MGEIPKKIILVGDVGVGKTSLILRFVENTYDENTISTISFDHKQKSVTVQKKTLTLHLWDTAGQERFGNITSSVYRKAKGVAYVYDVTREESFENLKQWMEEVNRNYNEVDTSNVVIVGNKCDLPAKVPLEVAEKFATEQKAVFLQVSAKTGDNVESIFTTLAQGLDGGDKGAASGMNSSGGLPRMRKATSANNSLNVKKKGSCVLL